MEKERFEKWVELIVSMCTDCLLGKISNNTFVSYLNIITKQLTEEYNEEKATAALEKGL